MKPRKNLEAVDEEILGCQHGGGIGALWLQAAARAGDTWKKQELCIGKR